MDTPLSERIQQERFRYGLQLKANKAQVRSADAQTIPHLEGTQNVLAQERNTLAMERTIYAKQRLVISIITLYVAVGAFAVSILRIFEGSAFMNLMYVIGMVLIVFTAFGLYSNVRRYKRLQVELEQKTVLPDRTTLEDQPRPFHSYNQKVD